MGSEESGLQDGLRKLQRCNHDPIALPDISKSDDYDKASVNYLTITQFHLTII
jgi:hypothetical protein